MGLHEGCSQLHRRPRTGSNFKGRNDGVSTKAFKRSLRLRRGNSFVSARNFRTRGDRGADLAWFPKTCHTPKPSRRVERRPGDANCPSLISNSGLILRIASASLLPATPLNWTCTLWVDSDEKDLGGKSVRFCNLSSQAFFVYCRTRSLLLMSEINTRSVHFNGNCTLKQWQRQDEAQT
jgi:hypothetical protein